MKRPSVRKPIHKLTIAVPVHNEVDRVEEALKQLLEVRFPVETEVLVIDDGSYDGTWELLNSLQLSENVRLLRQEKNRGKGAALRVALQEATGDVFVPFDADLEYDPRELPSLLIPLTEGKTEAVFGTRTFGAHTAYNFWYVVGNRLLCLVTNVLYNCYISDLETCFKMVRTEVLKELNLKSNSFDIEAEVTGKLLRAGYRPYEVPISYEARSREEGKKISLKDGFIAIWTVLRIRISPFKPR